MFNQEMHSSIKTGIVKWFDVYRGFGFIYSRDGDVFVHYSAIQQKGFKKLYQGDCVQYISQPTSKGLLATTVIPQVKKRRKHGTTKNRR